MTFTAFLLLLTFQLFIDNVFITTTNGLWKSVNVRGWADNPNLANLDLANVFYFPVYGRLVALLDWLGVFPGLTWKQMAVLNAAFAGAVIGCVYFWISSIFHNRLIGLLTALFYMGSGHFLTLSVINEDIMPSYFFVLVGMILAAVWFGRPTPMRIVTVAVVVTIGWLFEWRLLFPVVPPMLLALWLSGENWKERFTRPALFALGLCVLPFLVTVFISYQTSLTLKEGLELFGRLFWVGKGVGTGWGGFSWAKTLLVWPGMAESLVGGRHLASSDWMHYPANIWEVVSGTVILLTLLILSLRFVYSERGNPTVLAHFVIFGGTLLGGQLFNAYSQPMEPQMQINAMPWVIPAWAILMMRLLSQQRFSPSGESRPLTGKGPTLALLVSLFPMADTAYVLAGARGGNTQYLELIGRLEHAFDPASTVFLYQGFDYVIPWQFTMWSATWPDVDHLPPAPAASPRFKWISINDSMIVHPNATPQEHATELRRKIDHALALGYRVVTNYLWTWSEERWVQLASTIAKPETPIAIRRMLLDTYEGAEVFVDPVGGAFFQLRAKPQRPEG